MSTILMSYSGIGFGSSTNKAFRPCNFTHELQIEHPLSIARHYSDPQHCYVGLTIFYKRFPYQSECEEYSA
jgi:hypothetical protein